MMEIAQNCTERKLKKFFKKRRFGAAV